MLIPRTYKPKKEDILYHYCDAHAFHAICTNKKMRFSNLFSMNDWMEMLWGYSIWEEAASELIEEVGKNFLDEIDNVIHTSGTCGLLLGSCYSFSGDLLSQWRAYADDGNGFAIGFSAKDMIQLSARPLKVLYNKKSQIKELKKIILALYRVEQEADVKFSSDFKQICYLLAYDLAALKNPAFNEEQEVRLVHLVDFEKSNNFFKLNDAGGLSFGKEYPGMPVQFRMRENAPVAFIEQDFTDNGKVNPIKEVIIGPKNNVQPTDILVFLETLGIGSVIVKKSNASYR